MDQPRGRLSGALRRGTWRVEAGAGLVSAHRPCVASAEGAVPPRGVGPCRSRGADRRAAGRGRGPCCPRPLGGRSVDRARTLRDRRRCRAHDTAHDHRRLPLHPTPRSPPHPRSPIPQNRTPHPRQPTALRQAAVACPTQSIGNSDQVRPPPGVFPSSVSGSDAATQRAVGGPCGPGAGCGRGYAWQR